MFNYVEARWEIQRRLAVIEKFNRGEITEKEALKTINQMADESKKELEKR